MLYKADKMGSMWECQRVECRVVNLLPIGLENGIHDVLEATNIVVSGILPNKGNCQDP